MIKDLILKAQQIVRDQGDHEEKLKVGTLRGGNTGSLLVDGSVLGKCGRLSLARALGINVSDADETDPHSKELMFAAGHTNEDSWTYLLEKSWNGVIKREEEIPINWTLPGGTKVTGRPDIVLCDKDSKPVIGLELKLVSSLWTARDVRFKLEPKTDHLLQAGHYAWQLGIPFELWYTSRVNFAIMSFRQEYPKKGEPGSEYLSYNPKGEVKSTIPFLVGYELDWTKKGELIYRCVDPQLSWQTTNITIDGIKKYYESVEQQLQDSSLTISPRPANVKADGSKAPFNICNYCALNDTCTKLEKKSDNVTVAAWIKEVQKEIKK